MAIVPDYFWSKVDIREEDDCWEWMMGKDRDGYGKFWHIGQSCLAHRVAWVLTNGNIPSGLLICHTCDNPGCVNPRHLFQGTPKDNTSDMYRKGRAIVGEKHWTHIHPEKLAYGKRNGRYTHPEKIPYGEKSGTNKLTEKQVFLILELWNQGVTQVEIAFRFNIAQQTVSDICRGNSWSWLTGKKRIAI